MYHDVSNGEDILIYITGVGSCCCFKSL